MKYKGVICFLIFFLLIQRYSQQQIFNNQPRQFPKFIWIYNQEGFENGISQIQKLFLNNIERLTLQYQWKIVFLNDMNIKLYVENKDRFDQILQNHKNKIYHQNKIDLVKLQILYENGGVWIDFPVFLTQSLEWLNKLNTNLDVFNRKYSDQTQHPSIFMFSSLESGSNKQEKYWKEDQKILPFSGYQTWFLAAYPKSALLQEWRNKYIQYFSTDFDSVYYQNINQNIYLRNLDYSGKTKINIALQNVIQRKQHQLDQKMTLFFDKKREYAVQFYGIWTIKTQEGPTKLSLLAQNNQKQFMKYILKRPIQLLQLNHKYPKYLIKFNDKQIRSLQQFFFENNPKSIYQYSQGVFFRFVKFNKIFCEDNYVAVQDSLFDSLFASLLQQQTRLKIFSKTNYKRYTQSCLDLKMISQKSAFFGSFFGLLVGISIIMIWKLYLKQRKLIVKKKTIVIEDWSQNQQNQSLYNQNQEEINEQQQEDPYEQNEEDQEYYEENQQQKMNDQQQNHQENSNKNLLQMRQFSKQIYKSTENHAQQIRNKTQNLKHKMRDNHVEENFSKNKLRK